jgi:UPF0716 protein FxsA
VLLLVFIALLIAVPVAELYLIFQVAQAIGVLESVVLLVLISVVGGWLVRAAGMNTLARGMAQFAQGKVPTDELINGGIILVAGALMFTPGFLTDIVALALLLPPVRALVRVFVRRRINRRVARGGATVFGARFGHVVDVDGRPEWRPSRRTELP